jgi:hypothetical protein
MLFCRPNGQVPGPELAKQSTLRTQRDDDMSMIFQGLVTSLNFPQRAGD